MASKSGAGGSAPAAKTASLYVGDLDPTVQEDQLFELFNAVAPVASLRVCRHAVTRRSLGYAYVNFHTHEDAKKANDALNYQRIPAGPTGRPCRIMWSERDPSRRKQGKGNIYIKNLADEIETRDLHDTFSVFGNIISCRVVVDKESGKSRGFGFVHFEEESSALQAIEKVNGNVILDKTVYVGLFKRNSEREDAKQWTNLYVRGIPPHWDGERLKAEFGSFGEIASGLVVMDEATGKSKGFGYVDYAEHEAAKTAQAAMDGKMVEATAPVVAAAAAAAAAPAAEEGAAAAPAVEGAEAAAAAPADAAAAPAADADAAAAAAAAAAAPAADAAAAPADAPAAKPAMMALNVKQFVKRWQREKMKREGAAKRKAQQVKEYLGKNLYVRNIADEADDEILRKEFEKFGTVSSVRIQRDSDTNRSRGFGFICFTDRDDAGKALQEMNGMMLLGKPLYVALWQPKGDRRTHLAAKRGVAGQMGPGGQMGGQMGGMMGGQMRPMGMMGGYGQAMGMGMPQMGGGMRMGMQSMMRPQGMMPQGMAPQGMQMGMMQQQQMGMRQPMGMQQQRQMGMQGRQQQAQPPAAPSAAGGAPGSGGPLTVEQLAVASPQQAKNMIGERLYPLVKTSEPELCGKITGMLLDGMETAELLHLLENQRALSLKINEAMEVLRESGDGQ